MATTRNRVPVHSPEAANERIHRDLAASIEYFAAHQAEIPTRLGELDCEWDIERAIEANASVLALAGVALAVGHNRRWLALSGLVAGFLFQHAIQGWCPPAPVLRKLGFRTSYEIEEERRALKALRGDFEGARESAQKALTAAAAAQLRTSHAAELLAPGIKRASLPNGYRGHCFETR